MKVQAVFFDLFETLITEYSNGKRLSNRKYHYLNLLGITNEEYKLEWNNRQEKRMRGEFANYKEVISDILACRGLETKNEIIDYLYAERVKEKQIPYLHISSEVITLLKYLQEINIKIGLISNCTEEEVKYWGESRLASFFNDNVFSFEVKCCKPNIEIYSLACSRLKVKLEDCIFVGDGGSNELNGASNAGLKVYHATWFSTFIKSDFKKLNSPIELIKEIETIMKVSQEADSIG